MAKTVANATNGNLESEGSSGSSGTVVKTVSKNPDGTSVKDTRK